MVTTGKRPPAQQRVSPVRIFLIVVLFVVMFPVFGAIHPIPVWVPGLYLVASAVTFVVYAIDKAAARGGRRRIPERTLLTLGLIGGWPGAIIAQQALRHKTRKLSFQRTFWMSIAVNMVVFVALAVLDLFPGT